MRSPLRFLFILFYLSIVVMNAKGQKMESQNAVNFWPKDQLMAPSSLAELIRTKSPETPLLVCVGKDACIPGSVECGAEDERNTLIKMRTQIGRQDKNKPVVIYCGCSPELNCTDIKPVFGMLKNMGFKNPMILNLPNNLKTDWIDQGYPVKP
jgi:thiosulfate/3-mercaptopyruvate sulfurtransferase